MNPENTSKYGWFIGGAIKPPAPLNVNSLSLLFSWITRVALQNATDKQLPKRDSGATLPQIQSI